MVGFAERFDDVDRRIAAAVAMVEGDGEVSPVLKAVVREFGRKLDKARPLVAGDDERSAWEAIIELEQAGDSAKVAAEADPAISGPTQEAVLDGHLAICMLKAEGPA